MDRHLKQYDKDHIKMAMLKQEETFRHQVHELHRLYRVQKLMMDDMNAELMKRPRKPSNSRNKLEIWKADNQRPLDLPPEEYMRKNDINDVEELDSILELTLATGSKSRRRKKENSSTSDSGARLSSSSTESVAGVKLNGNQWGVFLQVPTDYVEEQRREERVKQPPWLFHCFESEHDIVDF